MEDPRELEFHLHLPTLAGDVFFAVAFVAKVVPLVTIAVCYHVGGRSTADLTAGLYARMITTTNNLAHTFDQLGFVIDLLQNELNQVLVSGRVEHELFNGLMPVLAKPQHVRVHRTPPWFQLNK